jgi:hypothetical protein
VKVRNEDGVSVITKVATKQLRYISITPRLKQLFLPEETTKQMRWHKEGKHESKETQGVFVLVCQRVVSNLTAPIVICTLVGQFL